MESAEIVWVPCWPFPRVNGILTSVSASRRGCSLKPALTMVEYIWAPHSMARSANGDGDGADAGDCCERPRREVAWAGRDEGEVNEEARLGAEGEAKE